MRIISLESNQFVERDVVILFELYNRDNRLRLNGWDTMKTMKTNHADYFNRVTYLRVLRYTMKSIAYQCDSACVMYVCRSDTELTVK